MLCAEMRDRILKSHSATLHVNLYDVKRHTFAELTHNSGMDTVGKRIRELRSARKLTQEQVAKAIGIKQGSFTQLETGKSKGPATSTLFRLARFFDVDPEWLMTGKGSQQQISSLSEQESELILLFRSVSQEAQQYVLGRARNVHQDEHAKNTNASRSSTPAQSPSVKRPTDGH